MHGHSLTEELIGRVSFTEMLLLDLNGVLPEPGHARVIEAILVALMEHGITPSTLAARLVADGAPESLQGAVAAGLLATGSRFLGTIEDSARMLARIVAGSSEANEDPLAVATAEVRAIVCVGGRVPGLGHNLLGAADPRVPVLLGIAREEGVAAAHVEALDVLRRVAALEVGSELIVNAAGATGAILADLGYPPEQAKGFALVARAGGLFAHVVQEQTTPIARSVWEQARDVGGSGSPGADGED